MSTLFTFPGQGAQRPGMLHELPAGATTRQCIEEASDTLAVDVLALDSASQLESTVSAQLCLLVAGVASARSLSQHGGSPDAVAGLSIGAYAAAVTASVLSFAEALRLVDRRARLMEAACPVGYGMTAILGLEISVLRPLIAHVHCGASPVYLANINAATQLVVAGRDDALRRVEALALASGANGIRPIAIRVPSHCALLADAAQALEADASTVSPTPPRLRYYSASLARRLHDGTRILRDLVNNMAVSVRWHETNLLTCENGVRLAVEMPPGSVLTKLSAVAALPDGVAVAMSDTRVDTVLELIAREARRDD